jgi:hypothetical protein
MNRRGFLRLGAGLGAGTMLTAAGAGVAVEREWFPGRARLHELLGLAGDPPEIPDQPEIPDSPDIPDQPVGPVVSGELTSRHAPGRRVGWSVLRPYGVSGALPVVIGLHGRGGHHDTMLTAVHLGEYLTNHVRRGGTAFAVASIDGYSSYFHPRTQGVDAGTDMGAVVLDDFLPLLARRRDLRAERVGFYGISMGGYGALRLASVLGPDRTAAVVATSPAICVDYADTRPAPSTTRPTSRRSRCSGERTSSATSRSASTAAAATGSTAASRRTATRSTPSPPAA